MSARPGVTALDGATWVAIILALAIPRLASAQTVVGTVMEANSERPLAASWVALLDPEGDVVTATLADEEGRFVLASPESGWFSLLVRRVGYHDTRSEAFELGEGDVARPTVRSAVRAVSLDGIRVDATKACSAAMGGDPQVSTLWSEARKGLEIVDWAEATEVFRYHVSEERMVLDASDLTVTALREQPRRGVYARGPYISRPAAELASDGYVRPVPDAPEEWEYFAPDAGVLLSGSFLDTHCFRIAAESDDRRVGLQFEPIEGRSLPDIQGVLWFDRASAEPMYLEYRYVGLPFDAGDWPAVGGRVEFDRLANGVWYVPSWYIRMPLEADPPPAGRGELTLRSLSQTGARVLRVETAAGAPVSEVLGATLAGVVTDRSTGRPIGGALVEIEASDHRTTTVDDGIYRLQGLPPGTFLVRVEHPVLEALGLEPVRVPTVLEEGRGRRMDIEVGLSDRVRSECAEFGISDPDAVLIYGSVTDSTSGRSIVDASVSVLAGGPEEAPSARVDAERGYRLCTSRDALADSVTLRVHPATRGATASDRRTSAMLPPSPTVSMRVDLVVDASEYASASTDDLASMLASESGLAVERVGVSGRIYDPLRGGGVGAARVRLLSAAGEVMDSAVADGSGRFDVQPTTIGPVYIEVSALGYSGRSTRIDFVGESVLVEVGVSPAPVSLDGLEVTVERRSAYLDRSGYYQRRNAGVGDFIDFEELDLRGDAPVSRILMREGGIAMSDDQLYFLRAQRPDLTGRRAQVCIPVVVIDDFVVRSDPNVVIGTESLEFLLPPASQISAIEVYPTSAFAPVRWKTLDNDCGVIAVWMRR
jgi:hypothetical protein